MNFRMVAEVSLSTGGDEMQISENHKAYWAKNLRITGILLAIWFVVSFVLTYFARDLNFTFFGWPRAR